MPQGGALLEEGEEVNGLLSVDPFSMPASAGPSDRFVGMSEYGTPMMETPTGQRYTVRPQAERMTQRPEPRPEPQGLLSYGDARRAARSAPGAIRQGDTGVIGGLLGAMVQGLTAPGRAARGEPVTLGDAWATALDYGGIANAAPAPAGALRSGSMRVTPKMRDDPYGFQTTKMDRPTAEIDVQGEALGGLLPRRPASIEDLQGKAVIPIFGDRTSADFRVDGIDDIRFDAPVVTEGGIDFARGQAHQADNAVWASDKGVMSTIRNRIARVQDEADMPVAGVHVTMAPNAVDFTGFGGEVFSEMVGGSKITKKAAKGFDRAVRQVAPTFPGTHSPDLRAWFASASPSERKAVIREAEKAPWQAAGYPAPGKMRYATADATQREIASGQAGLLALDFSDGLPDIPNPAAPHGTYRSQGAGDYIGQMPTVAAEDLWRDFFSDPVVHTKNGKPVPRSNQFYTMKLRNPYQVIDQELVDSLMMLNTERQR